MKESQVKLFRATKGGTRTCSSRKVILALAALLMMGGAGHQFATLVQARAPYIYVAVERACRFNDMMGAGRTTLPGSPYGGGNHDLGGWGVFVDKAGRIYLTSDRRIIRLIT